jgi:tetratricopeptide (TPR) repeat protein
MSEPIELPATAYDPETLREAFTDPDGENIGGHLTRLQGEIRDAPDETGELLARGDLVDLLRITGPLDDALDEANAAVDRADIVGTAAQQHLARLRLARVHQWRGDFVDSNPIYTELLAAATQFGPVIEAFTRQHAGENDYDQGHWDDAVGHFTRALEIRTDLELDDADRSRAALAAAQRHREPS